MPDELKIRIKLRYVIVVLLIILIASMVINVFFIRSKLLHDKNRSESNLIYPYLKDLSDSEFNEVQKYYMIETNDLKNEVNNSIQLPANATYSVYFENLNSGAYFGIREKERYTPGSLKKVPLLAALYKKLETGELKKTDYVTILAEDIDQLSGPLWENGLGKSMTISELINYTTYYSDNTAAKAIFRLVGVEDYLEAMFNCGLSFRSFMDSKGLPDYPLSAKEFINVFRTLYYSLYLKRESSMEILNLLSHTNFEDGIPKGVPANIVVSHKTGFWTATNTHNDCGIVYFPHSPYLLCVMVVNLDEKSANQVTAEISRITYIYVDHMINSK